MPEQFSFSDLRELFAKANEEKSGDRLAGIAAGSERERIAAKRKLADLSLDEIVRQPLIDPDDDDVSKLILDSFDRESFEPIKSTTVGEFREFLLDDATNEAELSRIQRAIIPEIAAAVTKIMSNKDLVLAAAKVRNVTHCRNTMGERGVLVIRIQPNHPTDDIAGILLSAFEGLLYGCGDAVIGVNPASDGVESCGAILRALNRLVTTYHIPTQTCCLAHISTQLAALDQGAPIDLLFQSVGGTEGTNRSFGITLEMLSEGRDRVIEHHRQRRDVTWKGENVMYFETGQGSALSAEAHCGVGHVTLEARHNSVDNLLLLLGAAGCNYFMGVPCGDDVMLNYQSTSYHDAIGVRRIFNQRPAPEFLMWLGEAGIYRDGELARIDEHVPRRLLKGLEWSLEGIH